jgi:hypothetical protein
VYTITEQKHDFTFIEKEKREREKGRKTKNDMKACVRERRRDFFVFA